MTTISRVWTVEEIDDNGRAAQRHAEGKMGENEDGTWYWVRPDESLSDEQKAEWDYVMEVLKNVRGKDLRHVVCFSGLLDHCLNNHMINCYREPGEKQKK